MSHNLHGDIPKEHLELAEDLLEMEKHFDDNPQLYDTETRARVYVCCAHDYLCMGDDDKASDLLVKADKVCPGYFQNQIKNHTKEDPNFAYLVDSLTEKLLAMARSFLG